MDSTLAAFQPDPASGRVYAARRIVRSTDVVPSGRLRLDALARYLQTAAEDDVADAGLAEPMVWLVRRCELRIAALQDLDRVLLDEDVGIDAVAFDDPPPLGIRRAELGYVHDSAVEQGSVIRNSHSAAPGALADQRADFVDPGLARVVNFKRGARDKTAHKYDKHDSVEQRPISLVERAIDEYATLVIGISFGPRPTRVRRHFPPCAGQ